MSAGRGRGELIRKLLESQSQSSSSGDSASGGGGGTAGRGLGATQDSGMGPSGSAQTAGKASGRGKLFEMLSSSSSSSPLQTTATSSSSGGRGRAALIQSLSQQGDSATIASSVILGRGRLRTGADTKAGGDASSAPLAEQTIADRPDLTRKMEEVVISEREPAPVRKVGTKGRPVNAVCNYIRLQSDPNKGVFEYEVRFSPNIDSRNIRMRLLNEHRDKFGGVKTFDGVQLYLPIALPSKVTKYTSKNPADGSNIEIQIIFKRRKPLRECTQLYNILFDRVMKTLNYVRFERKQFDPSAPKIIPQHRLEVWPGYVTAVDEYEGGVMLCCDVSHRLLCQTTVLDNLREVYQAGAEQFQTNAKKALLGSVVLTRYNNKTYRIDDINFDSSPMSTFQKGDRDMSYLEYYETQYNIKINDPNQPLLISMKQRRVAGKDAPEELMFCLVPEICYLTGLRDDLRSDFKVMRDIATFTRVTPNQRVAALHKFNQNVNSNREARQILEDWGLTLADHPERVSARLLDEETVYFARKEFPVGPNADFSRYATNNELLEVIPINNWLLIHTRNDMRYAKNFIDCLERNSRPMGIEVNKPIVQILDNDRTETYVNCLRKHIAAKTQIVVLICPTARDDRYAAIKKICCAEIPVPSQVINSRTLSNDAKNRSIVQKIALQMNCKLGGTLWSVKIPFQNVMICGVDSYHDAGQKGNSVSAFVASLNSAYTRWYSRAGVQTRKEEIVNGLCASLKYALQAYEKLNNNLPEKIILFRDGVGDGQLKVCEEYELPQLQDACKMEYSGYNPKFTFIVVQKRINTRIFADTPNGELQNPSPGFVLDHTVTRKYLYDFFLVSQSVRQGTVSPTHFVVVKDEANFSPDIIQRLSYKLCFLYYNWPGTVRVPACCQYAHKLAYLVGQSVKRPTSEKLADKLFYL